jgi:hypothetical protein
MKIELIKIRLFLLFLVCNIGGYAQEIPDMKGKNLNEVISYFDSHSMMYSQEKITDNNIIILRALIAQSFSKDSTKEINTLLLLKFGSDNICYFTDHIKESNRIIRNIKVPIEKPNSSKILVEAGSKGVWANFLILIGTGITIGGTTSSNVGITILGGAFSLSGIILNAMSWNKIKKSGEQMEFERIQKEKQTLNKMPQMKNPHQNENGEFYIK